MEGASEERPRNVTHAWMVEAADAGTAANPTNGGAKTELVRLPLSFMSLHHQHTIRTLSVSIFNSDTAGPKGFCWIRNSSSLPRAPGGPEDD